MTDGIHAASTAAGNSAPAVPPVDPWTLLKDAFGVSTQEEVAERAGIHIRTLQRMIDRPERSLMGNAFQIRALTGLGIDHLFPAGCTDLGEAA